MKTIEELIKDTVEEVSPNSSPKEKMEYAAMLQKSIEEGRFPSKEEFGITPDMLTGLYASGYRLYNSGNYNDASIIFSILGLMDSKNSDYIFSLGACHHQLKEFKDALNYYMAAFYMDTRNPLPFFHIADCYIQMKKPGHAIFSLAMVIAQAGDNPNYAKIKQKAELIRNRLLNEVETSIK